MTKRQHPEPRRWHLRRAEPAHVRPVRSAFTDAVRAGGASESAAGEAALVVSELLGNVVRHAPGPAWLALEWDGARPVLTVEDTGPGFDLAPNLPHSESGADCGRGLFIVAALAEHLSVSESAYGGARVRVRFPPVVSA